MLSLYTYITCNKNHGATRQTRRHHVKSQSFQQDVFFLPGMGRRLRRQVSGPKWPTLPQAAVHDLLVGLRSKKKQCQFIIGIEEVNGVGGKQEWSTVHMNWVDMNCRTLFFALDVACWAPMAPMWSPLQRKQAGSFVRLLDSVRRNESSAHDWHLIHFTLYFKCIHYTYKYTVLVDIVNCTQNQQHITENSYRFISISWSIVADTMASCPSKLAGCRLRLRGRGSRFLEGPYQQAQGWCRLVGTQTQSDKFCQESTDPLMLCVSSRGPQSFEGILNKNKRCNLQQSFDIQ